MNKKLLIVEDQPEALKMLRIALSGTDFQLLTADHGALALQIVKADRPAVVLLDIRLPGNLDGYLVCEAIKGDPDTRSTYVILTSGLADQKNIDEGRRVGADAYFVKPFRLSRLTEVVDEHERLAGQFLIEPATH